MGEAHTNVASPITEYGTQKASMICQISPLLPLLVRHVVHFEPEITNVTKFKYFGLTYLPFIHRLFKNRQFNSQLPHLLESDYIGLYYNKLED